MKELKPIAVCGEAAVRLGSAPATWRPSGELSGPKPDTARCQENRPLFPGSGSHFDWQHRPRCRDGAMSNKLTSRPREPESETTCVGARMLDGRRSRSQRSPLACRRDRGRMQLNSTLAMVVLPNHRGGSRPRKTVVLSPLALTPHQETQS